MCCSDELATEGLGASCLRFSANATCGASGAAWVATVCEFCSSGRATHFDWFAGRVYEGRTDRQSARLGMGFCRPYEGKGFATEAARALVDYVRGDERLSSVIAHTYPSIPASIRVMEKCGMVFDGEGEEAGTIRYRLWLRPRVRKHTADSLRDDKKGRQRRQMRGSLHCATHDGTASRLVEMTRKGLEG